MGQIRQNDLGSAKPPLRRVGIGMATLTVCWLALITTIFVGLINYANTPGKTESAPTRWPENKTISMDNSKPTLLLFAHPRCPCTRATMGELALLMATSLNKISAHVIFIEPEGSPEGWSQTDLWRSAEIIPGVKVHADLKGELSRLFHSETSGQCVVYDRTGDLRFQGGITISRGHSGDNPGRFGIAELAQQKEPSVKVASMKTPVFGCSLFEESCRKGDSVCPQQ